MASYKSTLYFASGKRQEVTPTDGKYFSLPELREFVGGDIEIVALDNGLMMVLDAEGKIKRKPLNVGATALFNAGTRLFHDAIAGDALVCRLEFLNMGDDDDDDDDDDY